jgi:hypothetical protein
MVVSQRYLSPTFQSYGESPQESANVKVKAEFKQDYNPETELPENYNSTNDVVALQQALGNRQITSEAEEAYSRLVAGLMLDQFPQRNEQIRVVEILRQYKKAISSKKKGGIISAQTGMSFAEYKAKLDKAKAEATQPKAKPQTSTMRDIRGTFADMSKEDVAVNSIALAGTAASFVPGPVGLAGGIGVTLAEGYKGYQDG